MMRRMRGVSTTCLLMAGLLLLPVNASAQESRARPGRPASDPSHQPRLAPEGECSIAGRAQGACEPVPSSSGGRRDSSGSVEGDRLWEGALLGGAVGLGAGATVALLADCPGARTQGSCVSDRAALVALAAMLGAGVGIGMDALIRPEFTGAPLPGPPASERRIGLPPPSSRGAGVRFRLAW